MTAKLPVLLALCLVATVAGAGQIYKWIDHNGKVHYSDAPRPGWIPVDLGVGTGAPVAGGDEAAEVQADSRQQLRAEECRRRQTRLDSYLNATQIVERDGLGREKVYSEDERLQLIEVTRNQVAELCGPPAAEPE